MLRGYGLLKFDAVVFQLCGQRPVAEIPELIADAALHLEAKRRASSLS